MAGSLQVWSLVFCRCFDRLPAATRDLITVKVDDMGRRLATFPHERLTGRPEFKLRVGDFRVLYEFDAALGRIHLLFVGHRSEIYKRP